MVKAAVIFAEGLEEIEAITPVDVLRRLGVDVDIVGLSGINVTGAHDIKLVCDKVLDDTLVEYDAVILPGGSVGAMNLRNSKKLKSLMQKRLKENKLNAAMCAAPIAFANFGLLNGADYTSYPDVLDDYTTEIKDGHYHKKSVVIDQKNNLITSRGPATALAYSYAIASKLGIDTKKLEDDMLYTFLKKNI